MDFIRRAYTTTVRPFRDSPDAAEIRWYFCADDAECLPFGHAFGSLNYEEDWITAPDVGEIQDAPRPYYVGGNVHGMAGDHHCGTEEQFRDGALSTDPKLLLDAFGRPTCCLEGGGGMFGSGGEKDGGAAAMKSGKVFLAQGGEKDGGAAAMKSGKVFLAQGGEKDGGAAAMKKGFALFSSGGEKDGGAATFAAAKVLFAAGGEKDGGAATMGTGSAFAASGGEKDGGAATFARGYAFAASGGEKDGGAATMGRTGLLYAQSTNTDVTCDPIGVTARDLLLATPGTLTASGVTASAVFVERLVYDVAFTAKAGSWRASLNVSVVGAFANARFRMQSINAACAVTESSPYSATISAAGTYTLSGAMTWPAGSNRVRISVELLRTGGPMIPVTVTVSHGTSSWLEVTY